MGKTLPAIAIWNAQQAAGIQMLLSCATYCLQIASCLMQAITQFTPKLLLFLHMILLMNEGHRNDSNGALPSFSLAC